MLQRYDFLCMKWSNDIIEIYIPRWEDFYQNYLISIEEFYTFDTIQYIYITRGLHLVNNSMLSHPTTFIAILIVKIRCYVWLPCYRSISYNFGIWYTIPPAKDRWTKGTASDVKKTCSGVRTSDSFYDKKNTQIFLYVCLYVICVKSMEYEKKWFWWIKIHIYK